jgi:hypothetical protein
MAHMRRAPLDLMPVWWCAGSRAGRAVEAVKRLIAATRQNVIGAACFRGLGLVVTLPQG